MNKKQIWTIVALVGGYILCQAIADIGATKLIQIAGVTMPAGTLIFAVTFTLRDMVHKRLGVQWARACIFMAGAFNILMSGYLALMAKIAAPLFFTMGEAWDSIFAIVPAIVIGSITAEMVSELVDTEVYKLWKNNAPELPQWSRVLVSNAISLPLDSLIFATLGFVVLPGLFGAESLPLIAAMSLVTGQIILKGIVTIVSLPAIYLVKDGKLI